MTMDRIVGGKFKIGGKIRGGIFSYICEGEDIETGEKVAIKMETVDNDEPDRLRHEAQVYELLQGGRMPILKWCGVHRRRYTIVTEPYGTHLVLHLHRCGGKFSLKTVLMLGAQLVDILEHMHSKGVVHRNICPSHLAMGFGRNANQVYLIDFGFAGKFLDVDTNVHIPNRDDKSLIGSRFFASIWTHCGMEQSIRDDLMSLWFVFIYYLKGRLPWSDLQLELDEILEIKQWYIAELGCRDIEQQDLRPELIEYIDLCLRMGFYGKISYSYLKKLFLTSLIWEDFQYDYKFDWTTLPEKHIKLGTTAEMPATVLATQCGRNPSSDEHSRNKICNPSLKPESEKIPPSLSVEHSENKISNPSLKPESEKIPPSLSVEHSENKICNPSLESEFENLPHWSVGHSRSKVCNPSLKPKSEKLPPLSGGHSINKIPNDHYCHSVRRAKARQAKAKAKARR